jgi:ferric-dicitrate binding protein FerR (iron transport regulator)
MKNEQLHNRDDNFLAKWLDGQISDKELRASVDDSSYTSFLKLRYALKIKDELESSTEKSFDIIKEKISKENNKVKVHRLNTDLFIGIAASIILLFGLFIFSEKNAVVIETTFGESKMITLLDGSEVVLNSKSSLEYDEKNWLQNRVLHLDGEAYFKVAKGETFKVNTANGIVEVLGTQFSVNSSKDYFYVECYEGKVSVKSARSKEILGPQQAVKSFSNKDLVRLKIGEQAPSWIKGESTFRSVPLRFVINALENQYQVNFLKEGIDDTKLFTGSFPHDSLDIALKTVFDTYNIKYSEKEKRNIELRYKE